MSKLSERRREIRAMTQQQAQEELQELRLKLFHLRLQHKRGEVKNNRQFPQYRADIARLLHHLGELRHAATLEDTGVLHAPDAVEARGTAARGTAARGTAAVGASEAPAAEESTS